MATARQTLMQGALPPDRNGESEHQRLFPWVEATQTGVGEVVELRADAVPGLKLPGQFKPGAKLEIAAEIAPVPAVVSAGGEARPNDHPQSSKSALTPR